MTCIAGTTPYPWPWDGALDLDRLVLLVTGWDDHWFAATQPSSAMIDRLVALAAAAPRTVLVAHRPPRRTDVTAGVRALPTLTGTPIVAAGIDAFYDSPLDALLRDLGATQLLIAGLGFETTVHSTLRRANDMGLECLVVVDACAPLDAHLIPSAVSTIEMSGGIFGAVGTTGAVVDALTSTTAHRKDLP